MLVLDLLFTNSFVLCNVVISYHIVNIVNYIYDLNVFKEVNFMKEVLRFKNMQEMSQEADDFLSKIIDPDIKVCAKFLLVSCYAYMSDFMQDSSKKTYANLSLLVKNEMLKNSQLHILIEKIPAGSTARKVYDLYYNCSPELKQKAQMHLMNLLLTFYIK